MSWQSYVDDNLLGSGCMYASINALEDGSPWASSPGFHVYPEEAAAFKAVFETKETTSMASNGFTVGGQRYTYTRGEVDDNDDGPMYIQGRCKDEGKSAQGVIIYCTTASFIVGVHDPSFSDGASFGKVNTQIGKVADYLIDAGF